MGADRKILSRTHRPGPIISTSALDHSTIAMANDDRQRASATPADIERNRWPASIGIRWPTSIGMPGRIHRNPQILFRRQTGGHVNYIVGRIKEVLEHYAESTAISVTVNDFDGGEQKFKTARESTIVVRSYIDDAETTYATTLRLTEVTSAPVDADPNRLVFLNVNGSPVASAVTFGSELERELRCTIRPDSTCKVESRTEFWVAAAEVNEHSPTRYTQALTLKFYNHSDISVSIKYRLRGGTEQTVTLNPGDRLDSDALRVLDLSPNQQAFAYQIARA